MKCLCCGNINLLEAGCNCNTTWPHRVILAPRHNQQGQRRLNWPTRGCLRRAVQFRILFEGGASDADIKTHSYHSCWHFFNILLTLKCPVKAMSTGDHKWNSIWAQSGISQQHRWLFIFAYIQVTELFLPVAGCCWGVLGLDRITADRPS